MVKNGQSNNLRKARSRDGASDGSPEDDTNPRQPPSMNASESISSAAALSRPLNDDVQTKKTTKRKKTPTDSSSNTASSFPGISPREPRLRSFITNNDDNESPDDKNDWNKKYANQYEEKEEQEDDVKAMIPTSSRPRQISRPGAFDVIGPGARRADSESSMEDEEEEETMAAEEESREAFRDEESGTVMIKATLVEEEDDPVTRSVPRDAVVRKPPLAHAEPWNNFLSMKKQQQQNDDEEGQDHRPKKICGMRRSMCFLLALGIAALLVLGPLLYFQLFADDGGSSSGQQDSLLDGEEEEGGDFAPSMAPTIEEPLLRHLDEYSHYIVEWGIQGNGCDSLTLPTLHLSCKNSNAIVDIRDHSEENSLVCDRLGDNLYECSSTTALNAGNQDTVLGTALVVCGIDSPNDSHKARALDLEAELQIGSYAEGCSLLIEENQVVDARQNVAQEYGGDASTWLNMNRICPAQSLERKEFNDLFDKALKDHKNDPPPPKNGKSNNQRLRQLSNESDDVDIETIFELHNRALCEQGMSDLVSSTGQSVCVDHSDCSRTRVCQADTLNLCASSCSIASGIVLASDLVVYEDRLDDCQTERLLPREWMWHFQQTIGQPTPGSLLA